MCTFDCLSHILPFVIFLKANHFLCLSNSLIRLLFLHRLCRAFYWILCSVGVSCECSLVLGPTDSRSTCFQAITMSFLRTSMPTGGDIKYITKPRQYQKVLHQGNINRIAFILLVWQNIESKVTRNNLTYKCSLLVHESYFTLQYLY